MRREELARERWICQPPGTVCHDWLVRTLRAAGYEPDIVHQAEENHTQLALVAAGLGVALIPRLGRGPLPAGVVAVPLDPCRCGGCTRCGDGGGAAAGDHGDGPLGACQERRRLPGERQRPGADVPRTRLRSGSGPRPPARRVAAVSRSRRPLDRVVDVFR